MPDYNTLTNRQGLIVWGGEQSVDFGMVVDSVPVFDKPTKRIEAVSIPGRNGSIIFDQDAFDDVVRTYSVWLAEDSMDTLAEKVSAATAWLYANKGYQRLEDNFEPDIYRLAYYSGANDITNELLNAGRTSLTFTCRPERFLKSAENPVSVTNGDTLVNPTRFASKPLIKITAAGTVDLSINGVTITAVVADYINIDVERMNAYRLPSENRNDKISGAFPVIAPGSNGIGISVSGTLTSVEITPRYFTI